MPAARTTGVAHGYSYTWAVPMARARREFGLVRGVCVGEGGAMVVEC